MSALLPLLDQAEDDLLDALARIGPVVIPALQATSQLPHLHSYYIYANHDTSADLEEVTSWLDGGAEKVIVPLPWAKELIGIVPPSRLLLLLDVANVSAVSDTLRKGVSGVLLKTPTVDLDLIASLSRFFVGCAIHVQSDEQAVPSASTIRQLAGIGASLVVPTSQLTVSASNSTHLNVADAFIAPIQSDRPDGLFPTIVSSHLQGGRTLGMVYSSVESIKESIITGKGV